MALNTGEALLRNENNYAGLAIIRSARVRACGYGGQILVADATRRLVESHLAEGVGLSDLGVYGLKGLRGQERIWQLTHPELPTDFPPLKAGASASGNLPTPISSFVGRRNELAAASHAIAANRLITFTGDTGVGKSRLALAVADATANSMSGGAWWTTLADLTHDDVDEVVAAIVQHCSIEQDASGTLLDALVGHFSAMAENLVVLDGADRAPTSTSHVVEYLLARCPDTRVVATARDPLQITGEVVHPVRPMHLPPDDFAGGIEDIATFDATRLFLERSVNGQAGSDGFTDEHTDAIVDICRRLRGVPLGLELAAARTATVSLDAVRESLGDGARANAALSEHGMDSTLASSIAWTYQLLDDTQRTVLRRLGVFASAFEFEAASAIVTTRTLDAQRAAQAITVLLDHHLVNFDQRTARLNMPGSVRDFANGELTASGEREATMQRYAGWFASVAERFDADESSMPSSLLELDEADLVESLDWALSTDDTSTALRLLVGLAVRPPLTRRPGLLLRASTWIAGRSPSDGEQQWAGAVARLSWALHSSPEAAVHRFRDEALAIAELGGDDRTAHFLTSADPTGRTDARDMAPRT
jgi:predicted ATPase